MTDLLRPDLILLTLAFGFLTAGICSLAIAIKRIACAWLWKVYSETLNGIAESVR